MTLRHTYLSAIILAYGFTCSTVCIARPQPAHDGAGPEQAPLPGRSDFSNTKDGSITGFLGDDKLPKHMTHVQDSIAEFPRNADAYPYDPDGARIRAARFQGLTGAQAELGSGEPQVLDEKTWALQKNPNWKTDTTIRPLPHYESGGKVARIPEMEQKWREDQVKKNPEWNGKWPSTPLPGGAFKTEAGLTRSIQATAVDYQNKNPGKQAKIRLADNPGWLPFSSAQLRAHEAPAIMMQAPHTKHNSDLAKIQASMPINKQKKKSDTPSASGQLSTPKTDVQDSKTLPLASVPRREGLRYRDPREPGLVRPSNPRRSGPRAGKDPNGYLRIPPTRPHYSPGRNDQPSKTPGIGPMPDKVTLTRIPPRPQNRESGTQGSEPNRPPSRPALKPIKGGRTGKEGTSHEAPEGKSPAQKHVDASMWKAYGSTGQSLSPKGKGKEPVTLQEPIPNLQSLPVRPKIQGKENKEPSNIDSQISGRLRSKANPTAVMAAKKAMEGSSKKTKKKNSKDKRDLSLYLLRRRLERRMKSR